MASGRLPGDRSHPLGTPAEVAVDAVAEEPVVDEASVPGESAVVESGSAAGEPFAAAAGVEQPWDEEWLPEWVSTAEAAAGSAAGSDAEAVLDEQPAAA
ncbi:MAG: hypothetical protein JWR28_855, partial [Modestobacter sp.]|nr:hypothetical protein [Modestobacter sp.]